MMEKQLNKLGLQYLINAICERVKKEDVYNKTEVDSKILEDIKEYLDKNRLNIRFFTTTYNYNQTATNLYSNPGYIGTWTFKEDVTGVKENDIILFSWRNSTKGCYMVCFAQVTALAGTNALRTVTIAGVESGMDLEVLQETGTSTTATMSLNAITSIANSIPIKTSLLTNDSNFVTLEMVTKEIDDRISSVEQLLDALLLGDAEKQLNEIHYGTE